jgi:putative holliday junction resolvase
VRVLAIDHGTVRCGCAISDPSGTIATPLESVPPDPPLIVRLVAEYDADRVVVGLPVSLSGDETSQADLSRAFAEELGDLLDVPVEIYDERLTTKMAAESARQGARADEDSLAAAHLLESYLASRAGGAAKPDGPPGGEG